MIAMIRLVSVDERNWRDYARLTVSDEQLAFLDRPIGIIARGYAYREHNARVIGIAHDGEAIGIALVKDMDEKPACYDLQQFMIDQRFQNRGYGTEALRLILAMLQHEGKYGCVEVCVNKDDAPALHVYDRAGFRDTGYTDDRCPDSLNLMHYFGTEDGGHLASHR